MSLFTLFKMLTMNSDKLVVLLALWLMCSFVNGDDCDLHSCETFKLQPLVGSSVLLPCILSTNDPKWVNWDHNGRTDLMNISSDGRVKFLDPRQGRVKAFPNQASGQNYSIRISELQITDLGCYRCKQELECLQVELLEGASVPSENVWLLIYSCAGVAVLFLLCLGGYFCRGNCSGICHKGNQQNTIIPISAGPVNDDLVYENDDQDQANVAPPRNPAGGPQDVQHSGFPQPSRSAGNLYPNLREVPFERVVSQRTRQRFHFEIITRIRQASINRHFYVNQSEITKQQARAAPPGKERAGIGRKKGKVDAEYQNPIYNRSTEQVNQMWSTGDGM